MVNEIVTDAAQVLVHWTGKPVRWMMRMITHWFKTYYVIKICFKQIKLKFPAQIKSDAHTVLLEKPLTFEPSQVTKT